MMVVEDFLEAFVEEEESVLKERRAVEGCSSCVGIGVGSVDIKADIESEPIFETYFLLFPSREVGARKIEDLSETQLL